MISCSDFLAQMGDYLEGEVADVVRIQIESHLAHCRTCQVIYDSSRKTVKIVTESGCFDLPEDVSRPLVSRVMERIRQAADSPEKEP